MQGDYLVVDAYNVINASSDLAEFQNISLEMSRDKLIGMMQEYASYNDCNVIIVFDAWKSGRRMRSFDNEGAVRIVYSKDGETADSVIERLSRELVTAGHTVYVATSDRHEQDVIFGVGALRKSARELLLEYRRKAVKPPKAKEVPFSTALAGRIDESTRNKLEKLLNQGEE